MTSVSPQTVLFEQDVFELVPAGKKANIQPWHSRNGLGLLLFVITASLAALFFGFFVAITWSTYPTVESVTQLAETSEFADRVKVLNEQRAAWLQQTTSLGQMMVFGSLIPVLSTIIGYLFGSSKTEK